MTFGSPDMLWFVGAAPIYVLALFFYDRMRRRELTDRLGDLPVLRKVTASASPRRRVVKLVLVQLGIALVAFALARPQIERKQRVELRGLDLVVAVDVSKSMLVDDVGPTVTMAQQGRPATRLGRARELAVALIDELPDDRIGPIVFAGAASHFPLTEDREVAAHFIEDLGPVDLPPGSNLSEVFRVARCLLRPDLYDDLGCSSIGRRGHGGDPLQGESLDPKDKKKEKDDEALEQKAERAKAIVLFTDGGDSDAETLAAVGTARELGIAVFVVGVGSQPGGIVHEIDSEGNPTSAAKRAPDGTTVVSRRDDAGMRAIAGAGGDDKRYFIASERGEVDPMPIVEALRGVNRGLATKRVKKLDDIYQPFLFAGFMLLLIEAAISTRRRRRFPEEH